MTATQFTAADARKLAGPSMDDHINEAIEAIKKAATAKSHKVALHSDLWVHGGYSQTAEWKEACDRLRKLGFSVDFFYEERQFVDMYTVVSWGAAPTSPTTTPAQEGKP